MTDRIRSIGGWIIAAVALVVIVGGVIGGDTGPLTDDERAQAIASNLRCPFCSGESIADASSQVARDLRVIIAEQVADGRTDDEIYEFFIGSYGETIRMTPRDRWSVLLWLLPVGAVVAGVAGIASRRRPLDASVEDAS